VFRPTAIARCWTCSATLGIASTDVRDLMIESVERRFGLVNRLSTPIVTTKPCPVIQGATTGVMMPLSRDTEPRETNVAIILALKAFRDGVTKHFKACITVRSDVSDSEYCDFMEEGRRLSNQCHVLQQELPRIFNLSEGPISELYPSMMRDYIALSSYCMVAAWTARPDLDNYGGPAEELPPNASRISDWKSLFDFSIGDLKAEFPRIGMTPGSINQHLSIFRTTCGEIVGQFSLVDQQEAQRREAGIVSPKTTTYNIHGPVGAAGDGATAHHFTQIVQSHESVDLEKLAEELDQLRIKLREKAGADDHDVEIGAVAEAAREAKKGNRQGVMAALRRAGTWARDVGYEFSIKLAAETIAAAIK
jgi:hypothetical protein